MENESIQHMEPHPPPPPTHPDTHQQQQQQQLTLSADDAQPEVAGSDGVSCPSISASVIGDAPPPPYSLPGHPHQLCDDDSDKNPPPYDAPPSGGWYVPSYPAPPSLWATSPPAYTTDAPYPGYPLQHPSMLSYPPQPTSDPLQQQQLEDQQQEQRISVPPPISMNAALGLSCAVFWLCGLLLGGIAFILAMIGVRSLKAGDVANALAMRKASYSVSAVGFGVGILLLFLFIF